MDHVKQIQILLSENEFLQLQLEDLNRLVKSRDEEISILGDNMDTAAALQSRIDNNLLEIEQLRYNLALTEQKVTNAQIQNEELETELLSEVKARRKDSKKLEEMDSVKANLNVANDELEATGTLYKKIQQLKKELSEANSELGLVTEENDSLKQENAELQELISLLKQKKIKDDTV